MSKAIENLQAAQQRAMAGRPKVGGFPACESIYLTELGPVVTQGTPLISGTVDIPKLDREALIKALRTDQAGESTFPEFLEATWRAGIVRYDVDFNARTVSYTGCNGEEYVESYPSVTIEVSG